MFSEIVRMGYGSAKTKIEFVLCGIRASGMSPVTIFDAHAPPPVPTGMARYCFPFTAYAIGYPCTSDGILGLVKITLPEAAS